MKYKSAIIGYSNQHSLKYINLQTTNFQKYFYSSDFYSSDKTIRKFQTTKRIKHPLDNCTFSTPDKTVKNHQNKDIIQN